MTMTNYNNYGRKLSNYYHLDSFDYYHMSYIFIDAYHMTLRIIDRSNTCSRDLFVFNTYRRELSE